MVDNIIDCDVAKEFLIIVSYCENSFLEKIPDYVVKKITDLAAESQKDFFVNENKSLSEQTISSECRDLIAIMYYMYVADENEKRNLVEKWLKNEENI